MYWSTFVLQSCNVGFAYRTLPWMWRCNVFVKIYFCPHVYMNVILYTSVWMYISHYNLRTLGPARNVRECIFVKCTFVSIYVYLNVHLLLRTGPCRGCGAPREAGAARKVPAGGSNQFQTSCAPPGSLKWEYKNTNIRKDKKTNGSCPVPISDQLYFRWEHKYAKTKDEKAWFYHFQWHIW